MDLFDLYQNAQIKRVKSLVNGSNLEQKINRENTRRRSDDLEDRVERLSYTCEALWELLKRQLGDSLVGEPARYDTPNVDGGSDEVSMRSVGLSDDELYIIIQQLSPDSGPQDGRRSRSPRPCECGAMVNCRTRLCAYCGAVVPGVSLFA